MLRERIADPEQIVRRPVEAIPAPPPWHRGRTVLIGDAVHAPPPTLAAGAAIVLEDAVVLDEMLAAGGDDVEATLGAFVQRRFEGCKLGRRAVGRAHARDHRPDPGLRRRRVRAPIWGELAKPY